MVHYECCFSSGRQHIFAEQPRWLLAGLLAVAICGLLIGLSMSVTISLAGAFTFEVVMVVVAFCTAYHAYLFMFRGPSSSNDVATYVYGNLLFAALLVALLGGIRCALQFDLPAVSRSLLFSLAGVLCGALIYGYVCLCLQEDERKHRLGVCSADGDQDAHAGPQGEVFIEKTAEREGTFPNDVVRFLMWICSWRWWFELQDSPSLASGDDGASEPDAAECIVVHNQTLKLVKVCLYSPDDIFCWVPFGGISGRCVGLVRAEERRQFKLHRNGASAPRWFQLKVFEPRIFDKELAYCPRVRCGYSYAFSDVEGMVRRSRLLSSPEAVLPSNLMNATDSSEDEAGLAIAASPLFQKKADGLHFCRSGGSLLRRITSRDKLVGGLSALAGDGSEVNEAPASEADSPSASPKLAPCAPRGASPTLLHCQPKHLSPRHISAVHSRLECRRAGPDEVVVRNRSIQDIRAVLFRLGDFCFMVPLLRGECMGPHEEQRFKPKRDSDKEFTLKLYSTGPGSKELTYLTVSRGQTYVFCDSLLS